MIQRLRSSDFLRHGSLVFIAVIGANVFTYLYYALIGRIVGVEGYGVVSALFSAALLIATPPGTVAATIVAKIAADLHATGDGGKLRRLGIIVSAGSLVVGLASCVVVCIAVRPIGAFFHLADPAPIVAAGAFLAFSFSLPAQRGVFQGAQSFGVFAISSIVEAVVKCVLGVAFALHFGPTGALIGLALGALVATAYNVYALLTAYGSVTSRLRLDFRRILITSTGIGTAVLAINALLFYDVIVVRHFFPAVIAGLYGAAVLAGRALYVVVSFVPTIVLPKASARSVAGSGTVSLLAAAIGTAAAIIVAGLCVVTLVPSLIVTILAGKHFADAAPYALPYTAALGALALTNVVAMYNIGLRHFAFVAPLCIVAIAEISFVVLWHASVFQVLTIILVGHVTAFATTLVSAAIKIRSSTIWFKDIRR